MRLFSLIKYYKPPPTPPPASTLPTTDLIFRGKNYLASSSRFPDLLEDTNLYVQPVNGPCGTFLAGTTDDRINTDLTLGAVGSGSLTISFQCTHETSAASATVVSNYSPSTTSGFYVGFNATSGALTVLYYTSDSTTVKSLTLSRSSYPVPASGVHTVSVTFDQTAATNLLKVTWNGVAASNQAYTGDLDTSPNVIVIGNRFVVTVSNNFTGTLWNVTVGGVHFPLSEGAGTTVYGYGTTGTVYTGTLTTTDSTAFWAGTQDVYHHGIMYGYGTSVSAKIPANPHVTGKDCLVADLTAVAGYNASAEYQLIEITTTSLFTALGLSDFFNVGGDPLDVTFSTLGTLGSTGPRFFFSVDQGIVVYSSDQSGVTLTAIQGYMATTFEEPGEPAEPPAIVAGTLTYSIYAGTFETGVRRDIEQGEQIDGFSITEQYETIDGKRKHTVTMTNLQGGTRPGALQYNISVPLASAYFYNFDLVTKTAAGSYIMMNELGPGTMATRGAMHTLTQFPWVAMERSGTGYAILHDVLTPVGYRVRYDGTTEEMYIVYDLGFAPGKQTATVTFWSWEFDPTNAHRQVVSDWHNLYAGIYKYDRILARGGSHGLWLHRHWVFSSPNLQTPSDFHIKFAQIPGDSWGVVTTNEANGYHTLAYISLPELILNNTQVAIGTSPTYSQVASYLASLAASGNTMAQAIVNSGAKSADGEYIYRKESHSTLGTRLRFTVNPYPTSTPAPNSYYISWEQDSIQDLFDVNGADGAMCDNMTFGYWGTNARTRIDFNTARHTEYPCPLVSSTEGDVGFNYEQMAYYATKAGHEEMSARSTLQPYFANALPQAETYGVNWRDIMSGEGIWNNSTTPYIPFDVRYLRKYRAYAGKKMLTFLQQAHSWSTWTYAITEKYMCRCGYVGAIPSFGLELSGTTKKGYFEYPTIIERDRPLFKKYLPAIKAASEAGWEPIQGFTFSNSTILGERFGDLDYAGENKIVYITAYNPSTTATLTFNVVSTTYSTGVASVLEMVSNSAKSWSGDTLALTVGPEKLAVLKITFS